MIPPRRSDLPALAAGAATLVLLGVCVAAAWPASSPLSPRHGGLLAGDRGWARLYLAASALALLTYAAGVVLVSRRAARLAAVAALAVAIQLLPLAAPLLISSDAWTYWDYGRIAAVHGGNPYRTPPEAFPSDPAFPYVGGGWRKTTSVYGPGFTLVSEPLALAAGSSADVAAWMYKALAALAMLVTTALATGLARRRAFACAFVGWNPFLALQFAGGGHNDAWMTALVLAALALAASGRRQLAGVAWAGSIFVKWIPLLFLPLRALEARHNGRPVKHLGFALTAGVVIALASWRYSWRWLSAFGPIARNADHESRFAIPHRIESLGLPHPAGIVILAAAFALAYVWLLRQAAGGRARLGLTAAFALLATPWLVPWYAVWAVPLAAVEEDRLAQVLSLLICAYLLRQAVPI